MSELSRLEEELLRERFTEEKAYEKAKTEFLSGTPLAYVLGEWYFYGLTFRVNEACLIPRPDTELVAEKVINIAKKGGTVADLCTGSGCIAVTVKKNRPDLQVTGYDISEKALEKAKENAVLNETEVNFVFSDVFTLFFEENSLDLIVSNPPYIRSDVIPTLETVRKEPRIALDGGNDGLDFYRHIISRFKNSLKTDGKFVFEIGYDQKKDLENLAKENGLFCAVTKDYGGNDRVCVLTR